MSSEKSVPGEGAREAELLVEMKKMQVSQITHFPENSREVPSSERELDATPIIPNPQDQDSPEGPADTSPVTSTAPGPNIPEIAEDTTPFTCTAQDHNTPEIAEDTAPATTAQDHNTPEIAEDTAPATCTAEGHSIPEFAENESSVTSSAPADNIPEITGDTTPVMGPSDTSSVISTAQGQGIPEFDEDEPPDTSSVIPTPPESTVPKDPANSPSTTPASVSPPGEIKIDSVEIDSVSLSWGSPDNMDGIPHSFHITYSSSDKSDQDSITTPSNSTVISELRPGREYSFTVTTVLENGTQSTPVSTSVCTKLHFVDEHRFALIHRVVSVETIADALLEKRILQETQYDEILAEKVSSAQMRLLYKFTKAWGNSEKDVFLEILKEQQPHLIKDLQGD